MKRKLYKAIDNPNNMSLLLPTRARPNTLVNMLDSIQETVSKKKSMDLWMYIDNDDDLTIDLINNNLKKYDYKIYPFIGNNPSTQGMMFNALCEACTTNPGFYVLCTDDYVFVTKNWDEEIRNVSLLYPDRLALFYANDPIVSRDELTWPVVTAEWVNAVGFFFTEYFPYWFDDSWLDQVSQMINRKVRLDFKVKPQGGKGKTNRMRCLPFWQYFFCNTLDERIEDAEILRKIIYQDDMEGYLDNLNNSNKLIESFKQQANMFSVDSLIMMEKMYSAEPLDSRPPLKYIKKEFDAIKLLYEKSKKYYDVGKNHESILCLDNILLASRKFKNVDLLLSKNYYSLGETDKAKYYLKKEIEINHQNKEASIFLAEIDKLQNSHYNFENQENNDDLKEEIDLGEKLLRIGDIIAAMKIFKKIIFERAAPPVFMKRIYNNVGVVAHKIRDMERAEYMFKSTLHMDPLNVDALMNLSSIYLSQSKCEAARKLLEGFLDVNPSNEQIMQQLKRCTQSHPLHAFSTKTSPLKIQNC